MKQEIRERIEKIRKGEVPEGYVKNKFGIYPDDWNEIPFNQIFDFEGGFTASRNDLGNKGIAYLHYGDIHKSNKNFIDVKKELTNLPKINLDIDKVPKKNLLKDGYVVFADASEDYEGIGKSITIFNPEEIPFINGLHTIVGIPKNGTLNKNYSRFFLLEQSIRKQRMFYAQGISVFGISQVYLQLIVAHLPFEPEQEKIAEILSTWDKAIELKEKFIKEKKDFKRGLMQRLLTGGTRFPKFTDEWEEKKINDILKYEQPNKYITNNIVDTDETLTPVLTANKSFVLGSTYDKNGIYTETPVIIFDDFTIDNKYVDFPFKIKSSAIKILKTKNDNVDIKFVYELMKFVKFPFGEHKRYYISEYQFVKIKMPKHIEQLKIVGVSNDLDSELKILNKELNQLKEQKRGLMQLLLTGIVRVEVD